MSNEALLEEILENADTKLWSEMSDDELAKRRNQIRDELAAVSKTETALKAERGEIDAEFMARLEARGTTQTGTTEFTISVRTEPMYPQVVDRTALENYILTQEALYLLQFRPSITALSELMSAGESVPGVKFVEKSTIHQSRKTNKSRKAATQ